MSNGTTPTTDATTKLVAIPETMSKLDLTKQFTRQSQDGVWYRLPGSGATVKLVRPSLTAMVAQQAKAPNRISQRVVQFMSKIGDDDILRKPDQIEKSYRENTLVFIELAKICLMEPVLVTDRDPDYEAGEIAPTDIPNLDYAWIAYSFIGGEAERLATFLVKPGTSEA